MILGYLWISEQEVIYNKPQGCLYAGKNQRITIRFINGPPISSSSRIDFRQIQVDLPTAFVDQF